MTNEERAAIANEIAAKMSRVAELMAIKKTRGWSRREKGEMATIEAETKALRDKLPAGPDPRRFSQLDGPAFERGEDGATILKPSESVANYVRERRGGYAAQSGDRLGEASFGRVLRSAITGDRSRLNEAEHRALGEASGSGSYLVAPELGAQVIDAARANAVAFKAGAGTLPMENGPIVYLPRLDAPMEASWHAENASDLPGGDQGWTRVTLTAKTLVAGPLKMSVELAEDVEGSEIDRVIRADLSKQIALELDRAIFEGDGSSNSPTGLYYSSGIGVVSAGNSTHGKIPADYSEIVEADTKVQVANGTSTAIVMHPKLAGSYALLTDSLGQPLRKPEAIANLPIYTTSQLATDLPAGQTVGSDTTSTNVYVGDFSTIVVGVRPDLNVRVVQLNERYLDPALQVGILAWMRCDVALRRPSSLTAIKYLVPAS